MQVDILEHSLSHEQRPGRQDLQGEVSTAQAMPKSGHRSFTMSGGGGMIQDLHFLPCPCFPLISPLSSLFLCTSFYLIK